MSDPRKFKGYKKQLILLQQAGLLQSKLQPNIISFFKQYSEIISFKLRMKGNQQNLYENFNNYLKIVLYILYINHSESSLVFIIKKCAMLHIFFRRGSLLCLLNAKNSETITNFTNYIIHQDLPKITKNKKSWQKSVDKICNIIRSVSLSKDKYKVKIQDNPQKGAIREFVSKVIAPFCSYLLKINEDKQIYRAILVKQYTTLNIDETKWKIMNYLTLLCNIIVEHNRLGKYFKEQLIGCWVTLYYLISTDVSVFFQILITHLSEKASQWVQKIALVSKICKINKKHNLQLNAVLNDCALQELVKQIQVVFQIREKILLLYFNLQLKKWLCIFQRPPCLAGKSKQIETLEILLDFTIKKVKIQGNRSEMENKDTNRTWIKRTNTEGRLSVRQISEPNREKTNLMGFNKNILEEVKQQTKIKTIVKKINLEGNSRQNNLMGQVRDLKQRAMGI